MTKRAGEPGGHTRPADATIVELLAVLDALIFQAKSTTETRWLEHCATSPRRYSARTDCPAPASANAPKENSA